MRWMGTAAIAALAWLGVIQSGWAAPPPASAFGRAPQVQSVAISADGRRVVMLGGAPTARTLTIATIDQPGLPTLALGDFEPVSVRWAGDYVLANVAFPFNIKGRPKERHRLERNIAVDLDGKVVSELLINDDPSQLMIRQVVLQTVDGPPPHAFVAGMTAFGTSAIWNVDPKTGRGVRADVGTDRTVDWTLDVLGQPRVRIDYNSNFKANVNAWDVFARSKSSDRWDLLFTYTEKPGDRYLGYSDADDSVFQRKFVDGEQQIVRVALKDKAREVIWRGPTGSPTDLIWDPLRDSVVGLTAGIDDNLQIQWSDAELGAVHRNLLAALHTPRLELWGWSADRSRFIVETVAADTPPRWYLFDRTRKTLSPLGDGYPELDKVPFGHTQTVKYRARDGLEIPALLTEPPTPAGGSKRPLIVLVEHSPGDFDNSHFDTTVQFLATRGYVVLRPQFRGSGGYGPTFETAGDGEWAGKMQTDLLDGIADLAAKGLIDPERACIVGSGFGGYAALAGATFYPAAYRCAVSINGIADPGLYVGEAFRRNDRESDSTRVLKKFVGKTSREDLASIAPLKHAMQVQAPILLMHGEDSFFTPVEQSTLMQAALTKAGKSVETVLLKDGGDDLRGSAPRTQMLERLEAFLAKHLPVTQP